MRARLDFGRAIETIRTSKALTREELARAARISHSYLSEIERGLKRPSAEIVARIARALGMKSGALLNYIEELSAPIPEDVGPVPPVQLPLRRSRTLPLFGADAAPPGRRAAPRDGTAEGDDLAVSEITVIARRLAEDDRRALLQIARHLLRRR